MLPPYLLIEGLHKVGHLAKSCENAAAALVAGIEDGCGRAVQATQSARYKTEIREPLAFRTIPEIGGLPVFPFGVQGLHEKRWSRDHPLACNGIGGLVVAEEGGEVPGGNMLLADPTGKRRGMIGVGARQWCKHSRCGPARNTAGSDLLEDLFGEDIEQAQTSCNPTGIMSEHARDPSLAHLMACDELSDEGRLFHGFPSSLAPGCKHPQEGLILPATPRLGHDRIALAQLERRHSPVTVDEHMGRYDDYRADLPILLDRGGKRDQ